jgi:hypothetical protein
MRQTVKSMPRLKMICNVGRMVRHSLAYFVWVAVYVFFTAHEIFNPTGEIASLGYASWFLMCFAGLASYILFFLIIWHLGTKERPSKEVTTRHPAPSFDLDASLRVEEDVPDLYETD